MSKPKQDELPKPEPKLPTKREIDFVRLSRGIPRAAAVQTLLHGASLEAGWDQRLEDLYKQEAAGKGAIAKAEKTPKHGKESP